MVPALAESAEGGQPSGLGLPHLPGELDAQEHQTAQRRGGQDTPHHTPASPTLALPLGLRRVVVDQLVGRQVGIDQERGQPHQLPIEIPHPPRRTGPRPRPTAQVESRPAV